MPGAEERDSDLERLAEGVDAPRLDEPRRLHDLGGSLPVVGALLVVGPPGVRATTGDPSICRLGLGAGVVWATTAPAARPAATPATTPVFTKSRRETSPWAFTSPVRSAATPCPHCASCWWKYCRSHPDCIGEPPSLRKEIRGERRSRPGLAPAGGGNRILLRSTYRAYKSPVKRADRGTLFLTKRYATRSLGGSHDEALAGIAVAATTCGRRSSGAGRRARHTACAVVHGAPRLRRRTLRSAGAATLGGADYLIEVPANWSGGLVVFAHGIQRGSGKGTVAPPPIGIHILSRAPCLDRVRVSRLGVPAPPVHRGSRRAP